MLYRLRMHNMNVNIKKQFLRVSQKLDQTLGR